MEQSPYRERSEQQQQQQQQQQVGCENLVVNKANVENRTISPTTNTSHHSNQNTPQTNAAITENSRMESNTLENKEHTKNSLGLQDKINEKSIDKKSMEKELPSTKSVLPHNEKDDLKKHIGKSLNNNNDNNVKTFNKGHNHSQNQRNNSTHGVHLFYELKDEIKYLQKKLQKLEKKIQFKQKVYYNISKNLYSINKIINYSNKFTVDDDDGDDDVDDGNNDVDIMGDENGLLENSPFLNESEEFGNSGDELTFRPLRRSSSHHSERRQTNESSLGLTRNQEQRHSQGNLGRGGDKEQHPEEEEEEEEEEERGGGGGGDDEEMNDLGDVDVDDSQFPFSNKPFFDDHVNELLYGGSEEEEEEEDDDIEDGVEIDNVDEQDNVTNGKNDTRNSKSSSLESSEKDINKIENLKNQEDRAVSEKDDSERSRRDEDNVIKNAKLNTISGNDETSKHDVTMLEPEDDLHIMEKKSKDYNAKQNKKRKITQIMGNISNGGNAEQAHGLGENNKNTQKEIDQTGTAGKNQSKKQRQQYVSYHQVTGTTSMPNLVVGSNMNMNQNSTKPTQHSTPVFTIPTPGNVQHYHHLHGVSYFPNVNNNVQDAAYDSAKTEKTAQSGNKNLAGLERLNSNNDDKKNDETPSVVGDNNGKVNSSQNNRPILSSKSASTRTQKLGNMAPQFISVKREVGEEEDRHQEQKSGNEFLNVTNKRISFSHDFYSSSSLKNPSTGTFIASPGTTSNNMMVLFNHPQYGQKNGNSDYLNQYQQFQQSTENTPQVVHASLVNSTDSQQPITNTTKHFHHHHHHHLLHQSPMNYYNSPSTVSTPLAQTFGNSQTISGDVNNMMINTATNMNNDQPANESVPATAIIVAGSQIFGSSDPSNGNSLMLPKAHIMNQKSNGLVNSIVGEPALFSPPAFDENSSHSAVTVQVPVTFQFSSGAFAGSPYASSSLNKQSSATTSGEKSEFDSVTQGEELKNQKIEENPTNRRNANTDMFVQMNSSSNTPSTERRSTTSAAAKNRNKSNSISLPSSQRTLPSKTKTPSPVTLTNTVMVYDNIEVHRNTDVTAVSGSREAVSSISHSSNIVKFQSKANDETAINVEKSSRKGKNATKNSDPTSKNNNVAAISPVQGFLSESDIYNKWGVFLNERIKKVEDVWLEYHRSSDKGFSFEKLDQIWAKKWKNHCEPKFVKKFNRRLVIIKAVQHATAASGESPNKFIEYLDQALAKEKKPISHYYTKTNIPKLVDEPDEDDE